MKAPSNPKARTEEGYALPLVMVLGAVSIVLYASMAQWAANTSALNDRNNVYNSAVAAAEGATEQVLSYVARDFANQSYDPSNLQRYWDLVPTNDWANGYRFSNGAGEVNQTWVSGSSTMVVTNLNSQFSGLYGLTYDCTVRAAAKPLGSPYGLTAGVQQHLQLASIPIFQFAIFYDLDLEINPGPAMKITGKVHGNQNIYTVPGTSLEYQDTVTAVGEVYNHRAPGDPSAGSGLAPVYDRTNQPTSHVSSLSLPVGTDNSPAAVRSILEVPPFYEDSNSDTGKQRYYNKADIIITVTDSNTVVRAGAWNLLADVAPDVAATTNSPARYSFVQTTASFYDKREGKNTVVTDVDVAALGSWMNNSGASLNAAANFQLGHQISSIYVNDTRTTPGLLTAVRVCNGQQLPPSGLTVATSLPLYVQGHFNAPDTTPGSTNTSGTLPGSLLGDSITILSGGWQDTNSTKAVTQRPAVDTTVNAAFLAGIVPSTNIAGVGHYSGGVENFPRFLEDWSGKTITYTGSMVVMFPSQFATNWWKDPGTGSGCYYSAPTRKWSFDQNFLSAAKLPPATPQVRQLIRGQWSIVAAK